VDAAYFLFYFNFNANVLVQELQKTKNIEIFIQKGRPLNMGVSRVAWEWPYPSKN